MSAFVATAAFFFCKIVLRQRTWSAAARWGAATFALHVAAGVIYYFRSYTHSFV